ncbi:MAG: hypothetical protein V2A73_09470, partial [Pseudomonadota bacterium]
RPFIGVPCHRRAADCCGENSTSKEEWNKELGTRHREQHNQRLLFTPRIDSSLGIDTGSIDSVGSTGSIDWIATVDGRLLRVRPLVGGLALAVDALQAFRAFVTIWEALLADSAAGSSGKDWHSEPEDCCSLRMRSGRPGDEEEAGSLTFIPPVSLTCGRDMQPWAG